jgi:hypothetical protein
MTVVWSSLPSWGTTRNFNTELLLMWKESAQKNLEGDSWRSEGGTEGKLFT